MPVVIVLGNAVLVAVVLLAGLIYPSAADWSYVAVGLIAFHALLELITAGAGLLSAARISFWSLQALSSLASVLFLLPYKLGWADWCALLVAGVTGVTVLITVIALIAFKPGGIADAQP